MLRDRARVTILFLLKKQKKVGSSRCPPVSVDSKYTGLWVLAQVWIEQRTCVRHLVRDKEHLKRCVQEPDGGTSKIRCWEPTNRVASVEAESLGLGAGMGRMKVIPEASRLWQSLKHAVSSLL